MVCLACYKLCAVLSVLAERCDVPLQTGEPGVTQIVAAAETVPSYQVEILTGADAAGAEDVSTDAPVSGNGTSKDSPFLARIGVVRELHSPQSDRSCVHIELDVSGSDISYEAGDHVSACSAQAAFAFQSNNLSVRW